MIRKTEVEFELNETIAFSRRDERLKAMCPECRDVVEMAIPHIAAVIAGISEREIYRRIEANDAHYREDDRILVCLNSLARPSILTEEASKE